MNNHSDCVNHKLYSRSIVKTTVLALFTFVFTVALSDTSNAQDINKLQGKVEVAWQKSETLADRYDMRFEMINDGARVLLLTHYYGLFGMIVDALDSNGVSTAKLRQMPKDTQGYIYNFRNVRRQDDSTLRFYGNQCWFYSVPPLHLSKLSWDYSLAYFETDNEFHFKKINVLASDSIRLLTGLPVYCNECDSVEVVWLYKDSVEFSQYDKNLTRIKSSMRMRNDTEEVYSADGLYRLNSNKYSSGIYLKSDSGNYTNYAYLFDTDGGSIKRIRLSNPTRNHALAFRPNRFVSRTLSRTDSTPNVFRVVQSDLEGNVLSDQVVLPQYSIEGEMINSVDGGLYVVGRAALAHADLTVDSSWSSIVCKLDSQLKVQWYHFQVSQGHTRFVSNVLERPDGSIWTVGYETPPQGQTTRWLTKYTIPKDTASSSVLENESSEILYPNPASDKVSLKNLALETGPVEVTLFDLSGKIVMRSEEHYEAETDLVIALPALNRGVYTICVRGAKQAVTRRVVVR